MKAEGIVEQLAGLGTQEAFQRIKEYAVDFEKTQETVLADILSYAADSEYGKKYHFSEIASVEEYRKKVPVTEFADYKEFIGRMEMGEEDILFPGRTPVFLSTSGTTGKSKNIPESDKGGLVKKIVSDVRLLKVAMSEPKIANPNNKIFAIMNGASHGTTKGGIPIGSASGQSTKAGESKSKKSASGAGMPLPMEVVSADNLLVESMDYLTLLYGLACEEVFALFCNNVAHFHKMMEALNHAPERFIDDIRNGTISTELPEELRKQLEENWKPNPKRAEKLDRLWKEKKCLKVEDIWPQFDFVGCWLSASVGRTVQEFKYLFPEKTNFFDWGYGASEGKFNIPMKPNQSGGLLATFGYFYEFLPVGAATPLLLKETEDGGRYELIITTYSGFYRYNIHDIVQISINADGSRNIEFICKSGDKAVVSGKTLYSCDLADIIESYEQKSSERLRLFQGKALENGLELLVEPIDALDRAAFETHVRGGLESFGVPLAGITYKEEGYRDSLFVRSLENGKTVNQTKLPVFI